MRKPFLFILIFIVTITWIEAKIVTKPKVLLEAEKISGDITYLYASGHVTLNYDDTLFIAEYADYNKQDKILRIFGDVRIINPDGSTVKTDKVTLHVAQKNVIFEKFLYTSKENIWLSSDGAIKSTDCYKLKQAMFSTCAITNPDWHLGFSEAEYNITSKYIKLRDIKFYVGETPIFYFPYLAFSTVKERSSGLLIPRFGYSSKEGFIYDQPIYWAINPSMDLEFNPQIRTNRSVGLYSTLRFADSAYSDGFLRIGYFKDTLDYVSEYNLKNSSHYGIEGLYRSSNVLGKYLPVGYQDAFYSNIVLFNDIDYLNLQKQTLSHLTDSHLKESRLNYMLYDDNYYFGINAKYFLDASKESNDDTLQELPSLRWHMFDNEIGDTSFSYSMDAKISHYMHTEGTASKQLEFTAPIQYELNMFDGYLKVAFSEEMYAFIGEFYNDGNTAVDSYTTLIATHTLKLYSDLVKPYSSGVHTLELSTEYAKQDYLGDGLNEYMALDSGLKKDFLSREPFDDRITLALSQYWHTNALDIDLKQKISQDYYPDRVEQWGDFRHELSLTYNQWNIKNLLEYSFEYHTLSEMSNKVLYEGESLYLDIEYFWRKEPDTGIILTNEIAFNTKYKYNKNINIFAGITYDLEENDSKKWHSGFRYDKGCWSIEFSYEHDTKPLLAQDGGGSVNNDTFLVKLNLVPFGESEIRQ